MPQYPPGLAVPSYPVIPNSLFTEFISPTGQPVANPNGPALGPNDIAARIAPNTTGITYNPREDLFPFPLQSVSATDANGASVTYTVGGKAIQLPNGTVIQAISPGPGEVFQSVLIITPAGSIFNFNSTFFVTNLLAGAQAIGAYSGLFKIPSAKSVAQFIAEEDAAVLLQGGGSAPAAVVASAPLVPGGVSAVAAGAGNATAGLMADIAPALRPGADAIYRDTIRWVGLPTGPGANLPPGPNPLAPITDETILKAINAIGQTIQLIQSTGTIISQNSQTLGQEVIQKQAVFQNVAQNQQQQVGQVQQDQLYQKDRLRKPTCLDDGFVSLCAYPIVSTLSGTGDIPFPVAPFGKNAPGGSANPGTGKWYSSLGAQGMQAALAKVIPTTGPYLPSFVEGLPCIVETYDGFTTLRQTLGLDPAFNGDAWFVPRSYKLSAGIPAGVPLPGLKNFIATTNGIAVAGPLINNGGVGLRIGTAGLRVGLSARQPTNFTLLNPSNAQIHWIQAVGVLGDRFPADITALQIAGAGPLPFLQVESGLFWNMDNQASSTDALYETVKTDGVSPGFGSAAKGQWFADMPFYNQPRALACFICFPCYYLSADRTSPSSFPTTALSPPDGGPDNYYFVTNWQGVDWFAVSGDPFNLIGGWKNAVASDMAYNPPPTLTCGNQHFRNDFIMSAIRSGGNSSLFVPVNEFAAAQTAVNTMVACLGGTTIYPATHSVQGPMPFTPIAIAKWGYAYAYSLGHAGTGDNPGFIPFWI